MATDNKDVQNQKVFVRLADVIEVQRYLIKAKEAVQHAATPDGKYAALSRQHAIENVLNTLGLPVL